MTTSCMYMKFVPNHYLYCKKVDDHFVYVILYVDDMLLVRNNMDIIK